MKDTALSSQSASSLWMVALPAQRGQSGPGSPVLLFSGAASPSALSEERAESYLTFLDRQRGFKCYSSLEDSPQRKKRKKKKSRLEPQAPGWFGTDCICCTVSCTELQNNCSVRYDSCFARAYLPPHPRPTPTPHPNTHTSTDSTLTPARFVYYHYHNVLHGARFKSTTRG